jgi:hypothetical protein
MCFDIWQAWAMIVGAVIRGEILLWCWWNIMRAATLVCPRDTRWQRALALVTQPLKRCLLLTRDTALAVKSVRDIPWCCVHGVVVMEDTLLGCLH